MTDLLAPLTHDEAATLAALRARLAARAGAESLLDVAYRMVDSPIGQLLLARTPVGLVRVAFAAQDLDAVLADLSRRISPRIMHAPGALDAEAAQLEDYFDGRRRELTLELDWQLVGGFRGEVLRHLTRIPYGRTESYRQVAAAVGNPKAVRATGTACATNPLPVVVPCHRVVRSDGSLGGYLAGLAAKRTLLDLESAGQHDPARGRAGGGPGSYT